MTQPLQPVRGTHDLIGGAMRAHRHVVDVARRVAELYSFEEMSTPVFEFSEVFHRAIGEATDIVSKETYTFEDRGGESLTLRPEFTAAIVRAFISNGLTQQLPFKAFYAGPAFRYERPQKGRMRQFHQIGIETLGADDPWFDIETIACGHQILGALGLQDVVTLELNTLGDTESREAYRAKLVEYFSAHTQDLSEESRVRLEKNPLRILDSKQDEDRKLIEMAPHFADYLTPAAKEWFAAVMEGLASLKISAIVTPRLVRGLDYYTHTVFEFTTGALGAQNAVLAGGRYDGLSRQMGGPDVPGIGWAAGIERLTLLLESISGAGVPETVPPVAVIPLGDAALKQAGTVIQLLRHGGVKAELLAGGNPGKRFKKADKLGASYAVVFGDEEIESGNVQVKHLQSGAQEAVPLEQLVGYVGA